jgi:hypothetical protein
MSGGDTTLRADETQALDNALQDLTLLRFQVVGGGRPVARMHSVVQFRLEADGVGAFPGGQDLFCVLRYVHRIISSEGCIAGK